MTRANTDLIAVLKHNDKRIFFFIKINNSKQIKYIKNTLFDTHMRTLFDHQIRVALIL